MFSHTFNHSYILPNNITGFAYVISKHVCEIDI